MLATLSKGRLNVLTWLVRGEVSNVQYMKRKKEEQRIKSLRGAGPTQHFPMVSYQRLAVLLRMAKITVF